MHGHRTRSLSAADLERVDAFREQLLQSRRKLDDLLDHARDAGWRDRVDAMRLLDSKLKNIDDEIAELFR